MKTFPMFLRVAGRRIVIIGGGEQAAQKARLALKTEAELVLVAPSLEAELADLVATGMATHLTGLSAELFDNTALVFVATGCKGADASWHRLAKAAGALVNVVDYPDLCDAITPSIVDRDPVVVAIGTEGTAPVLGRLIKSRIEQTLHPRLGALAALAGRLRAEVARFIPASGRRGFWHWVFGGAPFATFSVGNEREAALMIKAAITKVEPRQELGRLTLVSGATASELVTLGITERLQAADVIYIEEDVPAAIIELSRRDARRVLINTRHQGLPYDSLRLAANEAAGHSNVVYLSADFEIPSTPIPKNAEQEYLTCALPHIRSSVKSPTALLA